MARIVLIRKGIKGVPNLLSRISSHKFALGAMLVPLIVRTIPEILAGPYPVGWDTIAFYVPTTIYWASGKSSLWGILGMAPLIYAFSVPLFLAGINPVWTFKFMGPLLYGLLGVSLFSFLSKRLKWSSKSALGGALLASLYFVTLRIGWDMYRSVAGLSFLILALSLTNDIDRNRVRIAIAGLVVLSVVADQFTGVLALFIVGSLACIQLLKGSRGQASNLLKVLALGLLTFGLIVYAGLAAYSTLYPRQPPLGTSWSPMESAEFLGYAYLPLLPFAAVGFRRDKLPDMHLWSLLCLGGAFASSLPGLGMQALGYRWALLLTIPLCAYAAMGLSRISQVQVTHRWPFRQIRLNVPRLFAIFLILFASSYILLPDEHPGAYFTAYPAFMPSSLSQNTIPLSDSANVVALLHWLNGSSNSSRVLITHQAIYGWALEYLSASTPIINYGYGTPTNGISTAASEGYSTIFLIWWANGEGWFGQPNVPNTFVIVTTSGDFALYVYKE